ncbi:ANTAR domain-containing protein [Phaeacidiphilus oryzae]|uniref:ANTAR domain-containing protein n=1 Tax=Phaeacidiphilus oryzae TaxID=348818 RepID=UPI000690977D|nr:ANTAR domain-containing protein [Phaeacidiphilus oryzae]
MTTNTPEEHRAPGALTGPGGGSGGVEHPPEALRATERRTAEAFVELAGGAFGEGLDPRGLLQTLVVQCATFLPGCAAQAVAVVPAMPPVRQGGGAGSRGGAPGSGGAVEGPAGGSGKNGGRSCDVPLLCAGSDRRSTDLACSAAELDEGPAADCRRAGRALGWTALEGAHARQRWPRFAPHALRLGHRRVAAVPMRGRGRTVGALVLLDSASRWEPGAAGPLDGARPLPGVELLDGGRQHGAGRPGAAGAPGAPGAPGAWDGGGARGPGGRPEASDSGAGPGVGPGAGAGREGAGQPPRVRREHERPFSGDELELAQAMADAAGIALARELEVWDSRNRAEQLEYALSHRVVVEQAKGVLATRQGIGVDEAFELLRGYARRNRRRVSEVAREIVDGKELF